MGRALSASRTTGFSVARVAFPAGTYRHPPAGVVQLRVVRRGSSYATIDLGYGPRRAYTRPGDLLLSLPWSATSFRIDDDRELTMLQLGPRIAKRLLADYGAALDDLQPLCVRPFRDPLVAEICRRLEEPAFVRNRLGARALQLLMGLLLERAPRLAARRPSPVLSVRRLRAVDTYIDARVSARISVDELARHSGMAPRAFSSAFREATSLPVYQYVLRRRIERARLLIVSTDVSLAEVAQRSGFSHQAHMTRVFSRVAGRTPAQVRREHAAARASRS